MLFGGFFVTFWCCVGCGLCGLCGLGGGCGLREYGLQCFDARLVQLLFDAFAQGSGLMGGADGRGGGLRGCLLGYAAGDGGCINVLQGLEQL